MVDAAVLIDDAITLVEDNTILAGVIGLVSVCLCILLCLCICMRCSKGGAGNADGNKKPKSPKLPKKPKQMKQQNKGRNLNVPIKRGGGAPADRPRVFSSHADADDGVLTPDQILARQTQQQIHHEDKQGLINHADDRMAANYDLHTFVQPDDPIPQPIAQKPAAVQKDKVDYSFLMQKQDEYNHDNTNQSNVSAHNQQESNYGQAGQQSNFMQNDFGQNNFGQSNQFGQNNFGQNMNDAVPPPPAPPQQQQQQQQPFGVPNYQNEQPFVYQGFGFNS